MLGALRDSFAGIYQSGGSSAGSCSESPPFTLAWIQCPASLAAGNEVLLPHLQ